MADFFSGALAPLVGPVGSKDVKVCLKDAKSMIDQI